MRPRKRHDAPLWSQRQNLHLRISEQPCVAEGGPAARFIGRYDQKIRMRPIDGVQNFLFVFNFRHDFHVGLLDDRL